MAKKVNPSPKLPPPTPPHPTPSPKTSVRNREPAPRAPGLLQEAMAALFSFLHPPPKIP